MDIVNLHEAKSKLPQLVERAAADEEIIVAKDTTASARSYHDTFRERRVPGLD